MIVDRRAGRSPRKNVGGLADRRDPPVREQDRSVLDIEACGRARFRRVVSEGEDSSADDARVGAQGRMSFRRAAAMRSISASAVAVSVSESLTSRRSNAARMSALLLPLTAMMKGKPKRAR